MTYVEYKDVLPFAFEGLQVREMTPKNLRSVSIAEINILPGEQHQLSRSAKSDKIYICTEGETFFQVENKEILLKSKDVLLIAKGQWFCYRNDSSTIATVILIHVPPFDIKNEEFQNPELTS